MSGISPYKVNFVSLFMCVKNFLLDRFVTEFHASRFITDERHVEGHGTVVIAVFEVRVRFHVAVVFHRQSGVSKVVPAVRIVHHGDATFSMTRETYATVSVGIVLCQSIVRVRSHRCITG